MINISLSRKITFVFILTSSFVCLLFVMLLRMQYIAENDELKNQQLLALNYFTHLHRVDLSVADMEDFFKRFGFSRIQNSDMIDSVIDHGETIFMQTTSFGRFMGIKYNGRSFLFFESKNLKLLFKNPKEAHSNSLLWVGFVLTFLIILIMFLSIQKNLLPLKTLSHNINRLANGEIDIEIKEKGNDEIAMIAKEFDKAVSRIRALLSSRQLFLRTIMHELKTPIGKGRIVIEMIKTDPVQKKRLKSIFERLELLINEFSKMEQLASKSYALELNNFNLESIVFRAIELLMQDEQFIKENIDLVVADKNISILVDFELFALGIKNLLDNALKHGEDGKVKIIIDKENICISNKGNPLNKDFQEYCKAFCVSESKNKGLGLGLYIVENIVSLHDFRLYYRYENYYHTFCIDFS